MVKVFRYNCTRIFHYRVGWGTTLPYNITKTNVTLIQSFDLFTHWERVVLKLIVENKAVRK